MRYEIDKLLISLPYVSKLERRNYPVDNNSSKRNCKIDLIKIYVNMYKTPRLNF
jgi:hypothetical protein